MRRVSILGMMGIVGLIAIGITALRNADAFWQSIAVTLTLGILGVALLGVWQLRDGDRAWWGGFAAFGCGYLILTLGPWDENRIGSILATSYVLRSVCESAEAAPSPYDREIARMKARQKSLTDWLAARRAETAGVDDPTMGSAITEMKTLVTDLAKAKSAEPVGSKGLRALLPGSVRGVEFTRIGHCVFALVAALFGATVSRLMWSRREARPSRLSPDPAFPAE
jgi:hypothetical protein